MRKFYLVLLSGEGNKVKTHTFLQANTPATAAINFLGQYYPRDFAYLPARNESPVERSSRLYAVWSVGCSASGQRMWIYEQVGGFDQTAPTLEDF